jgi:hypothetical protein
VLEEFETHTRCAQYIDPTRGSAPDSMVLHGQFP